MTSTPRFPRRALAALSALSLSLIALSSHAALPEPALQSAITEFNAAVQGRKEAVDSSLQQFEALLKSEPGHPLALAYAGATTTLKARDAWMPWKKMSHAEDGLAMIDKALSLLDAGHDKALYQGTPLSLQTRFVAATTFLSLPDMFKRSTRGKQLLDDIVSAPQFSASPAGFQGAVLMWGARHAVRTEQPDRARTLYGEVVKRQLPQQAEAAAQLKGL